MRTSTHVPAVATLGPAAGDAIRRHMDRAFRALLRGEHHVEGPRSLRLLTGEPHPLGNFTLVSEPMALEDLREAVEPLVARSVPSAVLFCTSAVPGDANAYLVGRGFEPHGALPAMAVNIASLKPTRLPDGYDLVRVGNGVDGEEWVRQFARGYELPPRVAQCFSPVALHASTVSEAPIQFFAVRRHGSIVCTSACYLDDGVAGIYCVSTVPEERRKGLGAHATAEPLRLAAALGYHVGILQSSEAGHGVYRSLGFREFGGVPLYVRIPG